MGEWDEGKERFLKLVRDTDGAVQVVIPVTPSNGMFLIALSKNANRKFITLPEDDIIDLPTEADIQAKVAKIVKDAIAGIG